MKNLISKLFTITVLMLNMNCNSNRSTLNSKYEIVYSTSLNKKKQDDIYQIIKKHIADLPEIKDNKIKYETSNNKYFMSLSLKRNHFKLIYKSNVGYEPYVISMKDKIESIN